MEKPIKDFLRGFSHLPFAVLSLAPAGPTTHSVPVHRLNQPVLLLGQLYRLNQPVDICDEKILPTKQIKKDKREREGGDENKNEKKGDDRLLGLHGGKFAEGWESSDVAVAFPGQKGSDLMCFTRKPRTGSLHSKKTRRHIPDRGLPTLLAPLNSPIPRCCNHHTSGRLDGCLGFSSYDIPKG